MPGGEMGGKRVKKKCDGCKRMIRKLTEYRGKFLCYKCYMMEVRGVTLYGKG